MFKISHISHLLGGLLGGGGGKRNVPSYAGAGFGSGGGGGGFDCGRG